MENKIRNINFLFILMLLISFKLYPQKLYSDSNNKHSSSLRLLRRGVSRIIEKKVFVDTTYIKSFNQSYVLSIPIESKFLNFGIIDNFSKATISFIPNSNLGIGLGFDSRWFRIHAKTGLALLNKDDHIYGKTKYYDYSIFIMGNRTVTHFNVQDYTGFYTSSIKSDKDNVKIDSSNKIRKDLTAFNFNYNTTYYFNSKKNSFKNTIGFSEKQIKSSGSAVANAYYSALFIDSDTCILPNEIRNQFGEYANVKKVSSHKFGLSLGYKYTFVIKKNWYVGILLMEGGGSSKFSYTLANSIHNKFGLKFSNATNGSLILGFDNERFRSSIFANFEDYNSSHFSPVSVSFSHYTFGIALRYRVNIVKHERKFLKRLNLID